MTKYFNIFWLFLLAPVAGFYFAFYQADLTSSFSNNDLLLETESTVEDIKRINKSVDNVKGHTASISKSLTAIKEDAVVETTVYHQQQELIAQAAMTSGVQARQSDIVLEQVLSNLLGEPIGTKKGKNATIKVYTLDEAGYRGYMAKVTVHNSNALRMVLANDKIENKVGETPSRAAKRMNASLAINAGGFFRKDGTLVPLGVTLVDGKFKTFYHEHNYPFVGFDKHGQFVILNKITSKEQITSKSILQGASFRPILLKDGKKVPISNRLKTDKHPRTIIGNFSNGDLLFIVIDGRRQGWSNGISLEDAQDKLLSFKVKNAYNLDGGGSSAFYFNGKVLNKPSDGRERPVTTNIVVIP